MFYKNKIKVLLVIQTPPPFGGGEIQAKNLKEYFLNKPGYYIYDYSRKWTSRKTQDKYTVRSMLFGFYWIFKVCYLLFKLKPQKLYFTLPKSFLGFTRNAIVVYFACMMKTKILGELPGGTFPFINAENSSKSRFGKNVLKKIGEIRFLTDTINSNFRIIGVNNGIVIKNGVYLPRETDLQKYDDDLLRFIFIGTITYLKGFDLILETINELNKINIKFEFEVIGDFNNIKEKEKYLKYIYDNKLQEKLIFRGILTGEKKWSVFRKSQILVLPSYWEGVPLTILEALGLGLTIISTKLDGIMDTVEDGVNGYLVNTGNYQEIFEKILLLNNNRYLLNTFKENNIRKFKKEYSLNIFLNNMEKWFDE